MIFPQYHLKTKAICQSTLAQSFRLFSYILFLPIVLSNPLDFSKKKQKDYWPDTDIEFTGIPIIVVVSKVLDCHHGRDRHLKQKEISKRGKGKVCRITYKYGCCYFFIIHFIELVCEILKVQSSKLYNNQYMIASTEITTTEIFAFVYVLVFKLN